jgi:hypothetical protein
MPRRIARWRGASARTRSRSRRAGCESGIRRTTTLRSAVGFAPGRSLAAPGRIEVFAVRLACSRGSRGHCNLIHHEGRRLPGRAEGAAGSEQSARPRRAIQIAWDSALRQMGGLRVGDDGGPW